MRKRRGVIAAALSFYGALWRFVVKAWALALAVGVIAICVGLLTGH